MCKNGAYMDAYMGFPMTSARPDLTREQCASLLHYDPENGCIAWKVDRRGRWGIKAGMVAGYIDGEGYRRVRIGLKNHAAHRLAFLLMTGAWPAGVVDHMNGDRTDNRWSNLRDVSNTENLQNLRAPYANNRAGFLGVHGVEGGRYCAQIRAGGVTRHIGIFATPEEAHAAYLAAKRQHHAGCTV